MNANRETDLTRSMGPTAKNRVVVDLYRRREDEEPAHTLIYDAMVPYHSNVVKFKIAQWIARPGQVVVTTAMGRD